MVEQLFFSSGGAKNSCEYLGIHPPHPPPPPFINYEASTTCAAFIPICMHTAYKCSTARKGL